MPSSRQVTTPPTPQNQQRSRFSSLVQAIGTSFCLFLLSVLTIEARAQTATAEKTKLTRAGSETILKPGDNGSAVEDIQRRLNEELKPSPRLDIDGDYGDATRDAVSRFQRANGFRATGIIDGRTRTALGTKPIVVPDVPTPAEVNAQTPDKRPADSLDGPPFVSAKAWAIADGRTGEILWGDHQAEPLPMASTTKMMTALVVARIVERNPKVLDEVITFSERADETGGSTAGVRAGEQVTVRELLYGLMLPSGNDASVAFGEHFGTRLKKSGDDSAKADSLTQFIAEMNRVATELGLKETRFANTHGLPAEDHHSSAGDLAKLARQVLKHPVLASVVSTVKRGTTLKDAEGKTRNIVWSNTNRLLATEGYDGVKTGTTTAAGACLVASGHRGDDHLIVVILGAVTSDSRYLDAKNLFRWGWIQRGQTASKSPADANARPASSPTEAQRAQ
ncbi:D-alanyl-D-alanine carboxypeptidase (penicillin-binding protein 5/6) [Singulisphaera sp. GP187]|nr:D-alanyl-D-alanine carboxypeptidase (penicillin-binding protein 5/6) [Singulisphaera sp. GP187]